MTSHNTKKNMEISDKNGWVYDPEAVLNEIRKKMGCAWRCDGCKTVYYEDAPLEDCECGCTSFSFVGSKNKQLGGEQYWKRIAQALASEIFDARKAAKEAGYGSGSLAAVIQNLTELSATSRKALDDLIYMRRQKPVAPSPAREETRQGQSKVIPLTYEQEVHALLYAAKANTENLLGYFEAQAKSESGEAKRLTLKCIEWKREDLRRITALIPEALQRRDAGSALRLNQAESLLRQCSGHVAGTLGDSIDAFLLAGVAALPSVPIKPFDNPSEFERQHPQLEVLVKESADEIHENFGLSVQLGNGLWDIDNLRARLRGLLLAALPSEEETKEKP